MTITKISIIGTALLLILGIPLLSLQMTNNDVVEESTSTNESKGIESYIVSHQFNNVSGSSIGFSLNLTNASHYRVTYNLSTTTAGFELDGEWTNGSGRTAWLPCESIDQITYVVTGGDDHPGSPYADYFTVEVRR